MSCSVRYTVMGDETKKANREMATAESNLDNEVPITLDIAEAVVTLNEEEM